MPVSRKLTEAAPGAATSPVVEWIADPAELHRLEPEWEALLPEDAHPFDLLCWYRAWWEAFGAGRELAVCLVRRRGALVGAMPLLREGNRLTALANSHTPMFRPLAADPDAGAALMRAALGHGAAQVTLPAMPADSPWLAELEGLQRERTSMRALLEPGRVSPIVGTDGDPEQWRAESKRRWGAPLERFRRKMGRDFEAVLSIVEAPTDLDTWLEDGFRVEASGWKGRAGTAIVSAPDTQEFYSAIARAFHAREELRLSRIVLDGRTVAFDLCILYGSRLYLLKTGFDEDFRRLAPGLVLRLSVIERCFELGLDAHELLGDDSEWKRKFATSERRHVDVSAYRRGPLGSARRGYRAHLRPRVSRAYRRLRPRAR